MFPIVCLLAALKMWFRLRRAVVTHERHTRALRVPVGDVGREVLRTCPWTLLQRSRQCSGKRRHHRRDDVVQSEREVTVGAQSQVSSTVSAVSRCTRQLWTATRPKCHHWLSTRFVINNSFNVIAPIVNLLNAVSCCRLCWLHSFRKERAGVLYFKIDLRIVISTKFYGNLSSICWYK